VGYRGCKKTGRILPRQTGTGKKKGGAELSADSAPLHCKLHQKKAPKN
jgi:hypothetical protein